MKQRRACRFVFTLAVAISFLPSTVSADSPGTRSRVIRRSRSSICPEVLRTAGAAGGEAQNFRQALEMYEKGRLLGQQDRAIQRRHAVFQRRGRGSGGQGTRVAWLGIAAQTHVPYVDRRSAKHMPASVPSSALPAICGSSSRSTMTTRSRSIVRAKVQCSVHARQGPDQQAARVHGGHVWRLQWWRRR
jgi:hypothetical protein